MTARYPLCLSLLFSATLSFGQLDLQLEPVATGFSRPLLVTHAGDGSGRLFVVEQRGRIRIVDASGTLFGTDFLNLGDTAGGLDRVNQTGNERGLLGLAFHPDYPSNGRFFVSYTRDSDGASIIEEFQVSGDPNVADAGSGTVVFGPLAQPDTNHNGGHIVFGPTDGYLYYALGDGGGGGDDDTGHTPGLGNGQDTTNPYGTILRLDADAGLTAPSGNPFFGMAGFLDEIYAYGLRNPWRFSFDRGGTHRLFCGDVGQNAVEEIDIIEAGDNLGWRRMEGNSCFNPSTNCQTGSLVLPIHDYPQAAGRCSVTGGYVYRGSQFPNLFGKYFFADYCTGEIWYLEEASPGVFGATPALDTSFQISSFGEGEDGELYVCQFSGTHQVHRLIDANQGPQPDAEVAGGPLDFGQVEIGTQSEVHSLVLSNQGDAALSSLAFSLTGGNADQFDFDLAPDTSDLPALATREIGVRFSPTSEGFKSAQVTIESDDFDEPSIAVVVSGTGTIVPLEVGNWRLNP